jgi:hypothetical protein
MKNIGGEGRFFSLPDKSGILDTDKDEYTDQVHDGHGCARDHEKPERTHYGRGDLRPDGYPIILSDL